MITTKKIHQENRHTKKIRRESKCATITNQLNTKEDSNWGYKGEKHLPDNSK